MRRFTYFLLWSVAPTAAQPPPGYYNAAEGLGGAALQQALHTIISPHTVLANSALWQAFTATDARMDGTVWDMYSDIPGGPPAYVFQFVADQCGTYSSEGDCFNREHSFPQSWYGSQAPMSTDLFHIYPVDAWVNQQRGNWPFGPVSSPSWTSTNGGRLGPSSWPGHNGTVFEPIDAYKGDLARSLLYMWVRYLPQLPAWTNCPILSAGQPEQWARTLLLAWHEADPVSNKERDRQEAVFALQGNRNPFIDQPEWAAAIWGPDAAVADHGSIPPWCWTHDGWIHAQVPSGLPVEIDLVDMMGRSIIHLVTASLPVQVPGAGPGTYIGVIKAGERRAVLRLVR